MRRSYQRYLADLSSKPSTSLANPWPQPVIIPKSVVADNAADYESEVVRISIDQGG